MDRQFVLTLATALIGPFSCARADKIDDFVHARMAEEHIPGACIAVIDPKGNADVRSYGLANIETETPFSAKTVFRIASLSKQFCAYAVVALSMEGKIGLKDPVTKFLPEVPKEWEAVQIRHLLSHRSGIADPSTSFSYLTQYTPAEYLKVLGQRPLAEEPGSTFRYNNHGYAILGLIVAKVSGSSLAGFVKERVFDKAGMTASRYWSLEEIVPHRADAYYFENGRYVNALPIRPNVFHGSGGVLTSMEDMVRYELALRSMTTLDGRVTQFLWTPYSGEKDYGAGWYVDNTPKRRELIHTGTTFGFTSCFLRDLESKYSVILFRNSLTGDTRNWARSIRTLAVEAAQSSRHSTQWSSASRIMPLAR